MLDSSQLTEWTVCSWLESQAGRKFDHVPGLHATWRSNQNKSVLKIQDSRAFLSEIAGKERLKESNSHPKTGG